MFTFYCLQNILNPITMFVYILIWHLQLESQTWICKQKQKQRSVENQSLIKKQKCNFKETDKEGQLKVKLCF